MNMFENMQNMSENMSKRVLRFKHLFRNLHMIPHDYQVPFQMFSWGDSRQFGSENMRSSSTLTNGALKNLLRVFKSAFGSPY